MLYRGFVCLLLAGMAWGQAPPTTTMPAQPAATQTAPAGEAKPAEVPPDAPVITVKGICPGSDEKSPDCKTVITRAEFESMLSAISPQGVPPSARKQFATRYAMGLVMADQATKQGLDKGPRYEVLNKLAHLQVLSQLLTQSAQQKASEISDADVEDYYKKNEASYQEASLKRLFIPRTKQLPPTKVKLSEAAAKKRQDNAEAAMKTEAEALQKRALAGEDFDKLQRAAYLFAGFKAKPPSTEMGKIRRTAIPAGHAFVMDMKAGEVSKLISDPGGHFVYKMGAKDSLPLEKVKDEIHNTLRSQRAQASMQALQQAAKPELNDTYFALPPPPPQAAEPEDEDED